MNSNLLVGKYYQMDPETEDLIFGHELQEGMVVLIESAHLRSNVVDDPDEEHERNLLKQNRWCEVTKLRMPIGPVEMQVHFIGLYSDGTKSTRMYASSVGFYVKKDSLPKTEEPSETGTDEGDDLWSDAKGDIQNETLASIHAETEKAMLGDLPLDKRSEQYLQQWEDTIRYAKADAEASLKMFPGVVEETTLEAPPEPFSVKVDVQFIGEVSKNDILEAFRKQGVFPLQYARLSKKDRKNIINKRS